jgi:predicted O-methyltransferase YrrM
MNSLEITQEISKQINNQTFHHHYYVLYDIAKTYPDEYDLNYVEIGCYAGASACLMLQRKNTNVISIDLGNPIDISIVKSNVNKLNTHNNSYRYIEGNSHNVEIFNELKKYIDGIDILFIDGDHSYDGVMNDFELYSQLVKNGGYIVFDDYNDSIFSPDVKQVVDFLISRIDKEYEIIGTIENTMNAYPSNCIEGNCFIIRKKIKVEK